jgi:hypothetical protein
MISIPTLGSGIQTENSASNLARARDGGPRGEGRSVQVGLRELPQP